MRLLMLVLTIAVCVLIERTARYRFREAPFFRDYFTTDLVYLSTAVTLGLGLAYAFLAPLTAWFEAAAWFPRLLDLNVPTWALVLLGVAAIDLAEFVTHRLLHGSDALWELHKVHHSSAVVDWLATFRSHFTEQILRNGVAPAALLVVGFPLDATLLAMGIYTAFAVFNHSNTKLNLRLIEPLIITPRLHRMHHAPGATCQKNFGTVFTLWDRAMGTLELRTIETVDYGVPGEVRSYPQTFARQLVEPFLRWIRRDKIAAGEVE